MSTKLQERIAEIKAMEYSDEWKEKQIAGAILSAETRESIGPRPVGFLADEAYWPGQNPNDLPKEIIEDKDYE